MTKQFEKDKHFVKECVKWFVHNGVPVEKISIEVTPLNYVVLYGSRGLTRRPLMQVLHRTRRRSYRVGYELKRSPQRRAEDAHSRYLKVLNAVKAEPIEPWVYKEAESGKKS